MDVDSNGFETLDIDNCDREVYLVKVPRNWATSWAEADSDEELGTIVLPSDSSRPVNFFAPHEMNKPYQLAPRTIPKQQQIISEKGSHITIAGKVKHSYELRDSANRFAAASKVAESDGLEIIGVREQRIIQDADRSDTNVSMAWAGGRTVDSKGIADKFVARPKEEVLHDLILLFSKQDKYTFEDLNRVLQQPKPFLTEILGEYTTTETEFGKRHYKLRPEYRTH